MRKSINSVELWRQWGETNARMWTKAVYTNPYRLYQEWLKNIGGTQTTFFQQWHEQRKYMRNPALALQPATQSTSQPTKILAPLPPIGVHAERSRSITADNIALFARVSGDHNPIHLDAVYAARTQFGGRIAHGSMIASLISAVLGNDLPGPGTIYLGQTLKFLAPVRIGDTITARVEVVAVREDKRILTLRTDCTNQHGTLVLTGEATVKFVREIEVG